MSHSIPSQAHVTHQRSPRQDLETLYQATCFPDACPGCFEESPGPMPPQKEYCWFPEGAVMGASPRELCSEMEKMHDLLT